MRDLRVSDGLLYPDRPTGELTSVQRLVAGRDLYLHVAASNRSAQIRHTGTVRRDARIEMWDPKHWSGRTPSWIQGRKPYGILPRPRGIKLVIDPLVEAGILLAGDGGQSGARREEDRGWTRGIEIDPQGLGQTNHMGMWLRRALYRMEVDGHGPAGMTVDEFATMLQRGEYWRASRLVADDPELGPWMGVSDWWRKHPPLFQVRVHIRPQARVLSWAGLPLGREGAPAIEPPWWPVVVDWYGTRTQDVFRPDLLSNAGLPWALQFRSISTEWESSASFIAMMQQYAVDQGYDAICCPPTAFWVFDPKAIIVDGHVEWEEMDRLSYRGRIAALRDAGDPVRDDVLIEVDLKPPDWVAASGARDSLARALRVIVEKVAAVRGPTTNRQQARDACDALIAIQASYVALARLGRALGLPRGRTWARQAAMFLHPGAQAVGRLRAPGFEDWSDDELEITATWNALDEGRVQAAERGDPGSSLLARQPPGPSKKIGEAIIGYLATLDAHLGVRGLMEVERQAVNINDFLGGLMWSDALRWWPGMERLWRVTDILWAS